MRIRQGIARVVLAALPALSGLFLLPCAASGASPGTPNLPGSSVQVIEPDSRGGKAYRLVYYVPVPRAVYWRFKTDFDSSVITDNEHITEHRLLRRKGNTVITETRYTFGADAAYRWRTVVRPEKHRLEFTLLNPEECGQKFHYGYVEVEDLGRIAKVIQVAYFDFFGVFFWVHSPWSGGMRDILLSTVAWEQKTVDKLRSRYAQSP